MDYSSHPQRFDIEAAGCLLYTLTLPTNREV